MSSPTDSAAWDAAAAKVEYGHCSRCGVDLIASFGVDGPVIVSAGWCNACDLTTVWGVVNAE